MYNSTHQLGTLGRLSIGNLNIRQERQKYKHSKVATKEQKAYHLGKVVVWVIHLLLIYLFLEPQKFITLLLRHLSLCLYRMCITPSVQFIDYYHASLKRIIKFALHTDINKITEKRQNLKNKFANATCDNFIIMVKTGQFWGPIFSFKAGMNIP